MKYQVLNSSFGEPSALDYTRLTEQQENEILAGLFEQLLLFDKIVLTTNRVNFTLLLLIKRLGINVVERMFQLGYIEMMIWTPMLFTGRGRQAEDGSMDESVIMGQTPIAAGSLSEEDTDPEKNIDKALSRFQFHRDRRRIFTRIARDKYIVPNGMEYSGGAADMVIDAYTNNHLSALGLPFGKDPDQLEPKDREVLLDLSNGILETAIVGKYNLKSFENYDRYAIGNQSFENIGKAYKVVGNSTELFKLEGLPDLKKLVLSERLIFDDVFKLRHAPTAKYYRGWINQIGENADASEITKEYLNEIKGKGKFFNTTEGRFLKTLTMFGIGTALGTVLGAFSAGAATLGLGMFDTYMLENLLKGNNPSMFIDQVKLETKDEQDGKA